MECAEAAASAEKKTTDAAAAVKKNPKDPAHALEKTNDPAGEKKAKDAAVKKTKATFKPPRPVAALGKATADDAADDAGEEADDKAGEEAGEGYGGEDAVASQTSKSGGKGRKKAVTDQLRLWNFGAHALELCNCGTLFMGFFLSLFSHIYKEIES